MRLAQKRHSSHETTCTDNFHVGIPWDFHQQPWFALRQGKPHGLLCQSSLIFQKNTWKCGRPHCPKVPGSLEQELLQKRQTQSRVSGNLKQDQPVSTILNKSGPGMTFCYEKLNTAGSPNALFVPFPCFSLFSNSIWIACLLSGHSYMRQKKKYLLTQKLRISKGFPPLTELSKLLNSEHAKYPRKMLRKTEEK